MNLLAAVNKVLPFLGENFVSSVDASYNPTVSAVKVRVLEAADQMLRKGWWFNTRTVTLLPDTDGHIQVPSTFLEFQSTERLLLERRAGRVFDLEAGTDVFSAPVVLSIREYLDFEDLPATAQDACAWSAGVIVYSADSGVDNTVQIMQQRQAVALSLLDREQLRKMNYNTNNFGAARRLRSAIGGLYVSR